MLNEGAWDENEYTAQGREEHNRVHTSRVEKRGETVSIFELDIYSDRLGLVGKCDCVEAKLSEDGVTLPYLDGKYHLNVVEFKHGVTRDENEYNVQLCAQAMCLEEMYNCEIEQGAIFYISSHRRQDVKFTKELRAQVQKGAEQLKEMIEKSLVPYEQKNPKCRNCSLLLYCNPGIQKSAGKYIQEIKKVALSREV